MAAPRGDKHGLHKLAEEETCTYECTPKEAMLIRKTAHNYNRRTAKRFITRYLMGRLFVHRVK